MFESYISVQVSCGNHNATSCSECPQGNGPLWCNGDCKWLNEACTPKGKLLFLLNRKLDLLTLFSISIT